MASIIDRLLGRTETALAVVEPEVIETKAVTGPGAFAMTYGTPLRSLSRDPNRLMAEAQALFHTNVWVNAAERAIVDRFTRVAWHLENEDGETVDDASPEPYQAVLKLLERPSKGKVRRQLWGITARHQGLCGNAAWYLDQTDMLAGTPLSLLYVNPARLTPRSDPAGNVVGWVLDDPNNQAVNQRLDGYQTRIGTPLMKEEVIHFTLHEPDWGVWGVGIAEAAQRKVELSRLSDSHMGGILASGGRLSGLVSPKANSGTVTDDQWLQFVRDWRSITSDPDAAKRLQIAKMPLDFQQMTASPKDLQLGDVLTGNRDDILAAWGVPPSQIGINAASGLNSGEHIKYEEAALWQGAIEPRAEMFRETVQTELLDRFAELGVTVTLVLDYPSFDDEKPLYENAEKAKIIPLTVDQRLEQVGKDPLDPAVYGQLGQAIFIDQSMVPLFDPAVAVTPTPATEPPPVETNVEEATTEETEVVEGKADLRKPLLGLRSRIETTWEPKMRRAVMDVLRQQQRYIASRSEHIARKPTDLSSWWNEAREHKRFLTALEPLVADLAAEVAGETAKTVKKPEGKADTFLERVMDLIRTSVGERITGINQTTRDKVQAAIAEGVDLGESPVALGSRIRESAAFDEYRAELVSRTETGTVFNQAAVESYRNLDVERVQVIDGDSDAECASANGAEWSLDEAHASPLAHPNCVRDFIPVIGSSAPSGKATTLPEFMPAWYVEPVAIRPTVPKAQRSQLPRKAVNNAMRAYWDATTEDPTLRGVVDEAFRSDRPANDRGRRSRAPRTP